MAISSTRCKQRNDAIQGENTLDIVILWGALIANDHAYTLTGAAT